MPNKIKTLFRLLILLCVFVALPSLSGSDSVEYFYDNAGRLTRVLKDAEGITYQYDEVGNLLSITKSAISNSPPLLNGINPDVLFIDSTTFVVITGQNLFTTKEVTSDNQFLGIKILSVTDTEIRLGITVSANALPDTVNLTVTTLYGTANIQTELVSSRLSFSPGQVVLTPGSSGSITASILPSIGRDLTIFINNSSPPTVSVPQSLTIPSSGSATFTVTALNEGIATISSGDTKAVVFVTNPNPVEDVLTMADPVSVSIESPLDRIADITSLPVSVYIQAQSDVSATIGTEPVSVYIQTPSDVSATIGTNPVSIGFETPAGDSSIASLPVSVYIQTPSDVSATIGANPVSIGFETPAGDSSIASLPVSVYIQTPSDVSATIGTNPVSIYIETPTAETVTVSSLVSIGNCSSQPVKVIGAASGYYATLQDAYNASSSGDVIRSHAGQLTGDLNINQDKTITIEGGYDCDFTTVIGKTSLKGVMTISNGVLRIGNFRLEK